MAYKGIDVSAHNGVIDWSKVRTAGIEFAMLRMGYGTTTDAKFKDYYSGAKAAGIPVGGYWFSYALNRTQAIAEADACIKLLKFFPLDLPVFFDFEDDTERYAKEKGVGFTPAMRTAIHIAFCTRVKNAGYNVGIYANENYLGNLMNWSQLNSWPLWLAKWPGYATGRATGYSIDSGSVPTKWGSPFAWQFTDSGKVSGINGKVDLDYCYTAIPQLKRVFADKYTENGLTFRRLKTFRLVYHDSEKVGANYLNYANAGFFGEFPYSGGKYTLPVANLVCDPWHVPEEGQKDILPFVKDGKLRWSCADNHSPQFKGKAVSTLVVPASGKPYVADLTAPPEGCLYAISGVPTVRNGEDVDFKKYVKKQGWDDSCMRAAWRNWLGIRDGEIWLITGRTTANNYISGAQFWNWVKAEGFDDIICLDGGGSFIVKADGKTTRTGDNRRINTLVVFT